MAKPASVTPFAFSDDHPLADAHAKVAAWIEGFVSGQSLLEGSPEQSRRYVLAAIAQARHWDQEAEEICLQATTDVQRLNAHHLPGWGAVWGRRRQVGVVRR
jgi:hypothetical protein